MESGEGVVCGVVSCSPSPSPPAPASVPPPPSPCPPIPLELVDDHPQGPPGEEGATTFTAPPECATSPPPIALETVNGDSQQLLGEEGGMATNTPPVTAISPPASPPLIPLEPFGDDPGQGPEGEVAPPAPHAFPVLTDELREKIVRQVEYYFSDENLPTDEFLLKFVKKKGQGFVPIAVIASFRKMKKLVRDNSLIEAALRTSPKLVVSMDGKKVKRLHPLPVSDSDDAKSRTVLVKNLSENHKVDDIQKIFSVIGSIKNISIQGHKQSGEAAEVEKKSSLLGLRVHALVEYESIEAAKNAVASLNNESDWRNGLRVEPLVKQMGRQVAAGRGRKGAFCETHNTTKTSEAVGGEAAGRGRKGAFCETHNTTKTSEAVGGENKTTYDHLKETAEQEEKSPFLGKNEESIQSKRRGRGHGYMPSNARTESQNRAAPGPRMPDGTRGFTMGRGKPITQIQKDV